MEALLDGHNISGFLNVSVVLTCFIFGFVIKNYTKISNRFIPLIMLIVGTIANPLINQSFEFNTFLVGAISGLASTGTYELISKIFKIQDPSKKGMNTKNESSESSEETPEE